MTDADFIAWLKSSSAIKCVLVEAVARIGSTETAIYLSNFGFTTEAGDTPAGKHYAAGVKGGIVFQESLNLNGEADISLGDIRIDNSGGIRDAWLGYVWANRQIKIYMGDQRWPRSDFRKIMDGVAGDILPVDAEDLSIPILNKLTRLNNPLSETLLGGSTNNKDRLIPNTFGEVFNITPLLIDPALLKYQVHGGAVERIIEVRDNGAPVSFTATIADGTFVLNQAAVGTITCSVQGDKPSAYSTNISTIVQNLVQNYGPSYTRFSSGDLDATSLSAFAAAHAQPVGLYASDRTNVLAACQQLADSVGAQVVTTTLGLLRLVQITLPPPGTPVEVGQDDFDYHTLAPTARPPVVATCKLGYAKNWTPQPTGLAGGLPPGNVTLHTEEWLTTTPADVDGVAGIYKIDTEPPQQDTMLLVEADAVAEAERRRDLWNVQRTVYTAKFRAHLLLTELGDAITLTHPRFGLQSGVTGMVIGIARDWLGGRVALSILV